VAAATIALELLLIRVMDVILRPDLGHAVITCALFAFAISGMVATIRPWRSDLSISRQITPWVLAFAVATIALRPALNVASLLYELLPFPVARQLVGGAAVFLIVLVPFVFSGLVFAYVFSGFAA
jgi:hypothetical protein